MLGYYEVLPQIRRRRTEDGGPGHPFCRSGLQGAYRNDIEHCNINHRESACFLDKGHESTSTPDALEGQICNSPVNGHDEEGPLGQRTVMSVLLSQARKRRLRRIPYAPGGSLAPTTPAAKEGVQPFCAPCTRQECRPDKIRL